MVIHELWHTGPDNSELRIKNIGSFNAKDIIVRSEYSLISTGTERIVAKGLVPAEIALQMRVPGMEGSFDFPVKYGYSLAGKIISGPPDMKGKHIHLMHPHQDYVFLHDLEYHEIPPGVPLRRAVLAPVMETALNIIWDSDISIGDQVLICGFGLVGTMVSMLLGKFPGVVITVMEKDIQRIEVADEFGFRLYNENSIPKGGFDSAINTSGSEEGLQACIDSTAGEATILEASWYGEAPVKLYLGKSFHPGRKKIISSQVSRIPPGRAGRYSCQRRTDVVFQLMKDHSIDMIPIDEISFEESPAIFRSLRDEQHNHHCTIIKY